MSFTCKRKRVHGGCCRCGLDIHKHTGDPRACDNFTGHPEKPSFFTQWEAIIKAIPLSNGW